MIPTTDVSIGFALAFSAIFLAIVVLMAWVLFLPRLVRRKQVRAIAEQFSLRYQVSTKPSFSLNHPFRTLSCRTWKENILSGTVQGRRVEIFDSFHLAWPLIAPGRSSTYKETICIVDGVRQKLTASVPGLRSVSSIKTIKGVLASL